MQLNCLVPDTAMDAKSAAADRKSADRIGPYRISGKALYMQDRFLPLSAVKDCTIHDSMYAASGCCGRGFPVTKVRIDYGAEKPLVLTLEKKEDAVKMQKMIQTAAETAR